MAIDKAIDSAVLEANLKAVADAIREKGGTSDTLAFPSGFADAIAAIEADGGGIKTAVGCFQLSEDQPNYIIEHNLGSAPDFGLLWYSLSYSKSTPMLLATVFYTYRNVNEPNQTAVNQEAFTRSSSGTKFYSIKFDPSLTKTDFEANTANAYISWIEANTQTINVGCHTDTNDFPLSSKGPYRWLLASGVGRFNQ